MRYETITVHEDDVIRLPRPENYKDCFELINSDHYRIKGRKKSHFRLFLRLFIHPYAILPWFRLCQYRGLFYPICSAMYSICKHRHKIDMKERTKVGYGLNIGHSMCMVINPGTIIGNNCDLSQFLNIGTNHSNPAIIGDEVYIGPGVCVVEDARIGSHSTIGAGAVVRKHIPQGSTAVGVPARVVNYNPKPYIRKPYPLPSQV